MSVNLSAAVSWSVVSRVRRLGELKIQSTGRFDAGENTAHRRGVLDTAFGQRALVIFCIVVGTLRFGVPKDGKIFHRRFLGDVLMDSGVNYRVTQTARQPHGFCALEAVFVRLRLASAGAIGYDAAGWAARAVDGERSL